MGGYGQSSQMKWVFFLALWGPPHLAMVVRPMAMVVRPTCGYGRLAGMPGVGCVGCMKYVLFICFAYVHAYMYILSLLCYWYGLDMMGDLRSFGCGIAIARVKTKWVAGVDCLGVSSTYFVYFCVYIHLYITYIYIYMFNLA